MVVFEWRLKFECVGDLEGFIVNFFAGIYSICKFLFQKPFDFLVIKLNGFF